MARILIINIDAIFLSQYGPFADTIKKERDVYLVVNHKVEFLIYEHERKVAIEANTPHALEFLRSSKHELREGKFVLLNDHDAYITFDAIDVAGYSTLTQ